MASVVAFVVFGVVGATVTSATDVTEASCGLPGQGTCPQQRRGQALLQQYTGSHQQTGALHSDLDVHPPAAYVQVGSSGIGLPAQLALWTNGSAGLAQLQEKARAKKLGTSPEAPQSISQWIAETLIPQAQLTVNELNQEIDAAFEEAKACQAERQNAEEGISDDLVQLTASEQRHSDCATTAEQEHREALQLCGELTDLCKGLDPPTPLKRMKGSSSDEILSQLRTLHGYWNDKYATFTDEKKKCETSQGIEADYSARCAQDKHNIENSYCALKKTKMNICSDYKGCFADKLVHFDKVVSDVKVLQGHVQSNFKAMKCFNFESDEPKCDADAQDVSHLNVHPKDRPIEQACSLDVNTGWDYSAAHCPELEVFEAEASTGNAAGPAV